MLRSVQSINSSNITAVAKTMSKIKPEFWDEEGAVEQLEQGVGWFILSQDNEVLGWLLCKHYTGYKTVEIDCLGYNDNGTFKVDPELLCLFEECEDWARKQDCVNVRFVIGSKGLSCHGKIINEIWKELKELKAINRDEFNWLLSIGYKPSGILPDIYGYGHHGIMLIKHL